MNARTPTIPDEAARQPSLVTDEQGTPMPEIVRLAVEDYLRRLDLCERAPQWLQDFWRDHPMPLPTGLEADRAFYDSLHG